MKKIFIFIAILFLTFSTYAQTTVTTPTLIVIPPSPNAASLGIYGDIPIGHYTGIPSINIPLYEVISGDIKLPINLSYQSSGIKVAQEASWVGLGWALNAGGVITRSIRGWDDFADLPLGYVRSNQLPPANGSNCLNTNNVDDGGLITLLDGIYHNQIDAEPDIFYYNFGNYSGKFVFPKIMADEIQAIILNQDPIDVRYNISKQVWTVITPDGSTYTFATPENNYIYSSVEEPTYPSYGNTPRFSENNLRPRYPQPITTNSWYLDTIKSPQGDKIQFNYTKQPRKIKSQQFIARNYGAMDAIKYIDKNHSRQFLDIHNRVLLYPYDIYSFSQFETDEVLLNEITFNNGSVKFESVNRGDLLYTDYGTGLPQRLNKMYVTNSSGQTITSYQFMVSYRGYNTPDERRLFLDSIVDMSGKTHRFYYNQTDLPKKASVAVDHWGYYNGKTSNQEANIYTAIPSYTSITSHFSGANRDATDDAQAGILTKIAYPTGGYSEFEYSLNEYSNHIMEKSYKDTTIACSYIPNISQPPSSFVLSGTANVHVVVSLGIIGPFSCAGEVFQLTPDWSYIYFFLQQQYSNNGGWSNIWQSGGYNKILCNEYHAGTIPLLEYNITLDPGTYRISTTPSTFTSGSTSTSEPPVFIVNFKMNISQEYPITFYRKGGGLRIKEITRFDGKDSSTVHYEYTKKNNDSIISSGRLMSFPKYHYKYMVNRVFSNQDEAKAIFTASISESIIPLGTSAQGHPVGYDQVTEIYESKEYSGKTVYYFHNQEENVDLNCWIPGIPNQVYNGNSLLKKKEYWDAQDRLFKEEYYQHQKKYDTRLVIKGFKMFSFPKTQKDVYLYKFYDTMSEWWYLAKDSTVVYDYSTSPARKITTANLYRHDNSLHKQVTTRATTNSNGTTTNVIYKYPSDYNSVPYTAMVQRHIINPIIASETQLTDVSGSSVIDATMQQYKEVYPDIFKPEVIKKLETNTRVAVGTDYTSLMKEIISYKYNAHGKYIELISRDGMISTYLWGYQYQYPIAEIMGASYEQVKTVLGENLINNLATGINPDIADLDIRLRNGFKDKTAWITTYTYQPLIGMTSKTDPNGITTYYEYDEANRLKIVRDHEGNVLNQYEYHYHQNE
jgi:YD repeat-containing protein